MINIKLKKENLSEQLTDILKENIINGVYKNGEKLPSEMELSKSFNVSRLTVRSALHRLNALGLVTTKAGDGTYVDLFNLQKYVDDTTSVSYNEKTLKDLLDFRQAIELESLRLAIEKATDEEIDLLTNISEDFTKRVLDDDMDDNKIWDLADIDFKLHLYICELSKNPLYGLAFKANEEIMKDFFYAISVSRYKRAKEVNSRDIFRSSMEGHLYLCKAIKDRDFQRAKKILLNHMDYKVLSDPFIYEQ